MVPVDAVFSMVSVEPVTVVPIEVVCSVVPELVVFDDIVLPVVLPDEPVSLVPVESFSCVVL